MNSKNENPFKIYNPNSDDQNRILKNFKPVSKFSTFNFKGKYKWSELLISSLK